MSNRGENSQEMLEKFDKSDNNGSMNSSKKRRGLGKKTVEKQKS
jgi:hypothetical protein